MKVSVTVANSDTPELIADLQRQLGCKFKSTKGGRWDSTIKVSDGPADLLQKLGWLGSQVGRMMFTERARNIKWMSIAMRSNLYKAEIGFDFDSESIDISVVVDK